MVARAYANNMVSAFKQSCPIYSYNEPGARRRYIYQAIRASSHTHPDGAAPSLLRFTPYCDMRRDLIYLAAPRLMPVCRVAPVTRTGHSTPARAARPGGVHNNNRPAVSSGILQ